MRTGKALVVALFALFGCKADFDEVKDRSDGDRIALLTMEGEQRSVAWVRGRKKVGSHIGCGHDVSCGTDLIHIENFLPPVACQSEEVTVFSEGNGFSLTTDSGILTWSTEEGDEIPIPLGRKLTLDVKVWILDGDAEIKAKVARVALNRAQQVLNSGGCGFEVNRVGLEDLTEDSSLVVASCEDLDSQISQRPALFLGSAVNIYYIDRILPGGDKGKRCKPRFALLVTDSADGETLAHEMGHAMTLEHIEDYVSVSDIPRDNIMRAGPGRASTSTGQCFRANMGQSSALYVLGRKSQGLFRNCDFLAENLPLGCPGLRLKCN